MNPIHLVYIGNWIPLKPVLGDLERCYISLSLMSRIDRFLPELLFKWTYVIIVSSLIYIHGEKLVISHEQTQ